MIYRPDDGPTELVFIRASSSAHIKGDLIHYYHHHMALQPKLGPGLPFWGFLTITFLRGWIVRPAPNPQPGGVI
jgi:hypothetical protein